VIDPLSPGAGLMGRLNTSSFTGTNIPRARKSRTATVKDVREGRTPGRRKMEVLFCGKDSAVKAQAKVAIT